jgi:rhodanese-related sulfurtransferase
MSRMIARTLLAGALLLSACAPRGAGGDEQENLERIAEMYEGYHQEFPEVTAIEADELAERLAGTEPPVLVDVRTDEEREVSIIPGAISRQEFETRRGELDGREVVTYCTIGYRSGLYADELRRQGWEVANLRGSILAWTHAGGELEAGGEPTRRLHVYGRRWDLAADGFETVW